MPRATYASSSVNNQNIVSPLWEGWHQLERALCGMRVAMFWLLTRVSATYAWVLHMPLSATYASVLHMTECYLRVLHMPLLAWAIKTSYLPFQSVSNQNIVSPLWVRWHQLKRALCWMRVAMLWLLTLESATYASSSVINQNIVSPLWERWHQFERALCGMRVAMLWLLTLVSATYASSSVINQNIVSILWERWHPLERALFGMRIAIFWLLTLVSATYASSSVSYQNNVSPLWERHQSKHRISPLRAVPPVAKSSLLNPSCDVLIADASECSICLF